MRRSLALIGCGKMGGALLEGWLKNSLNFDLTVIQPDPLPDNFDLSQITYLETNPVKKTYDIIVFAVKPQILDKVITNYKDAAHADTLILSIAAGKDIKLFENTFGIQQPIIRTMPNTPAAIGEGITALIANTAANNDAHKHTAETLFDVCGDTLWIKDETQMDAVTAISGSGPAYLFYFMEALTKSAEALGFDSVTAAKLARQTIIGAAALADHDAETPASTLRQNVTSPGGTTEAALKVLMDGRWQEILQTATKAAEERSKELK